MSSDGNSNGHHPALYLNRESSLLSFHRRVLAQASDRRHPLLERVKFLAIAGANVEEFLMVRVAGRRQQVLAGIDEAGPDGMTSADVLQTLEPALDEFHQLSETVYGGLMQELAANGILLRDYAELTPDERARVDGYFQRDIYPLLTPMAFDVTRPFPHVGNHRLKLAVVMRDAKGSERFGWVRVPETLPQLVAVSEGGPLIWLEELIGAHLQMLFPAAVSAVGHAFLVTRDADVAVQEWEAMDLIRNIEEGVRRRHFGSVVQLSVAGSMPQRLVELLVRLLPAGTARLQRYGTPLAHRRLLELQRLARPVLKDPAPSPRTPRWAVTSAPGSLFEAIRRETRLLHHPFDSFQPVVDFLEAAAADPDVLAIKSTLYRVGANSPIVRALMAAADGGKQVTAVVEVRARFDEQRNIEWARALERKGVHVVYGLAGLKVHAKAVLVVRREGDEIRRYMHLSTGNYNYATAQVYTDLGLLTDDEAFGVDGTELFNFITGFASGQAYQKLLAGPMALREKFLGLIRREIAHGRAGRLIFKTNALVDGEIIDLLYEASQAGVEIDLLVRGICCLRPGLPGVSENIRVTSIVGRFLEHGRVYYFGNGGDDEVYLGSADLMPRNLNWRVELLFPVEAAGQRAWLRDELLGIYLRDNVNAWRLRSDGEYDRLAPAEGEEAVDSHACFQQ